MCQIYDAGFFTKKGKIANFLTESLETIPVREITLIFNNLVHLGKIISNNTPNML